jgi:uncharacterized membrane protein
VNVKKVKISFIIMFMSIIYFILGFIQKIPGEMRYLNHLAAGFSFPTSLYVLCFFLYSYFRSKHEKKSFRAVLAKSKLKICLIVIFLILTISLEIIYQFFLDYNPDSPLQFAFTVLGIIPCPFYVYWFWKK